ncbi:P-loop containing nucleoside triphosphate hydrolase protein [Desarmillaria tabescens]|uniref:DNA 3'-5' helicase n=1 Tax=Armillaria tabescens TaxID=1929756 RepID=A0AA39JCF4_ARMTA|nr:P-loop containing nucleoside triphosphate hydrolase protein [Desarmillaria tabescens]KAK0440200.1 P-loop containing nucleoside triphosphate hydrolase protein [Desarmillaria tabescens]
MDPPQMVTYVVVPNRDLLLDHMKHTREFKMETCQWLASKQDIHNSKVVYLALESAGSDSFEAYWTKNEKFISRICFDEIHQMLSHAEFRPAFNKLQRLAKMRVPHIYLTASLPVRMEEHLLLKCGLPSTTPIIRSPTNRTNISYNIIRWDNRVTTELHLLTNLVNLLTEHFLEGGDIGIIFAESKHKVNLISKAITHCKSHADMNFRERAEDFRNWSKGIRRWIVASTTLIHGIDLPNVGAVIFLGPVFGLLNIVQGGGRILRSGRFGHCIVLTESRTELILLTGPEDHDFDCEWEGRKWLRNNTVCRRIELSRTMDGKVKTCHDLPGCFFCDICKPDSDLLTSIDAIIKDPGVPQEGDTPSSSTSCADAGSSENDEENDRWVPISSLTNRTSTTDPDWLSNADTPSQESHPVSSSAEVSAPPPPPPSAAPNALSPASRRPAKACAANVMTQFRRQAVLNNAKKAPVTLPGDVSTSVAYDAALVQANEQVKHAKVKILSEAIQKLEGKCPICWASKSEIFTLVPGVKHTPFLACRAGHSYVHNAFGWIDFKKRLKFTKYQYCYMCGVPQKPYLPDGHPTVGCTLEEPNCPVPDFIVLIIWHIRQSPAIWSQAIRCPRFLGLTKDIGLTEFTAWCMTLKDNRSFHNAVELVIWFLQERASADRRSLELKLKRSL